MGCCFGRHLSRIDGDSESEKGMAGVIPDIGQNSEKASEINNLGFR